MTLLDSEPQVINVGLLDFAQSLAAQDVPVVQVEWSPPQQLEDDVADLLEALG